MSSQRFLPQVVNLGLLVLLLAGCSGAPAASTALPMLAPTALPSDALTFIPTSTPELTLTPVPEGALASRQALFVIFDCFEETEYGAPRTILEDKGVVVSVASSRLEPVTGHLGKKVQPDVRLSDVVTADYDVIVFVGGYEYEKYNGDAVRIAQEAAAQGKILAAICVAPITLAKAGVLKDKRATTSLPASQLTREGAIYTGAVVERDGLIITGNGPRASYLFGNTIAEMLDD